MADTQDTKTATPGKIILLSVLLVLVAALGVYALTRMNTPPAPFLSFASLPEGTVFEANLIAEGQTSILAVENGTNDIFVDPARLQNDYALLITLRAPDNGAIRDIAVRYEAGTGTANILADGFSDSDTIALFQPGEPPSQTLNFDWSGKIEFTASIPKDEKSRVICLETSAAIALCHALPERTGA